MTNSFILIAHTGNDGNVSNRHIHYLFLDESCRTYAILATDSGDEVSSLEYDNTCVGDGGMIVQISDGRFSVTSLKGS